MFSFFNNRKVIFPVFLFLVSCSLFAQTKTNYEIVTTQVKASYEEIQNKYPDIKNVLPEKNSAFTNLNMYFSNLVSFDSVSNTELYYSINNVKVEYKECFRLNFLGSFYTERNIQMNGNYSANNLNHNFEYAYKDTVKVADLNNLEGDPFPFTKADKPEEPLLSTWFEPVVAISSAAAATILFFVVRSK